MISLADMLGVGPIKSPTAVPDFGINTPDFSQQQPQRESALKRILGGIGDAISVGAGGLPYHKLEQEKQQLSQALQGFDQDPSGTIAAVARHNPEMAQQLMQMQQMRAYREAMLPIRQQAADAKTLGAQAAAQPKIFDSVGRLLKIATPETYDKIKEKAQQALGQAGYDLPLPDRFDSNALNGIADNIGQSVKDRRAAEQKDRSLDQGDRKIDVTDEHYQRSDAAAAARAGAAQTSAGAAASRASTYAAESPSRINKNNAQADKARSQPASKADSLRPPSASVGPLAKYEGKTVFQNGVKYRITNGKAVPVQ